MRHFILLTAMIACATNQGAQAQDLEPNLARAARRLAEALVLELPARNPAPAALVLVPDWGCPEESGRAVREALLDARFRVLERAEAQGRDDVLGLQLSSGSSGDFGRLVLQTVENEPVRLVCLHGDATWVDATADDLLHVEGPLKRDPGAALLEAQREARSRLLHTAGLRTTASATEQLDVLMRLPGHSFVGAVDVDGTRLWRGYVSVTADEAGLRTLREAAHRVEVRQRAEPWMRGGATLLLAVLLGLFYLKADLRTRGYVSGRLRLLFGTLFLVGAGLFWRLPL